MARRLAIGTAAVALAVAQRAAAYDLDVHRSFVDQVHGNRQDLDRPVDLPGAHEPEALRLEFYDRALAVPGFGAAYGSRDGFASADFKEFLGLAPRSRAFGFDRVAEAPVAALAPLTWREALREASVDPDTDYRNQHRFWRGPAADEVPLDALGKAVPHDPRTLWFGARAGTPTQLHAHGAMRRGGSRSGSIFKALTSPRDFARPPVALGDAPDFVQTYTDLAVLAELRRRRGEGGEWMVLSYKGGVYHTLEDLGNQIHTTLVGHPGFVLDAKKAQFLTALRRRLGVGNAAGGASAPRVSPPARLTVDQVEDAIDKIRLGREREVAPEVLYALDKLPGAENTDAVHATRIISNHHFLIEAFFQEEFGEALGLVRQGRWGEVKPGLLACLRAMRVGDAGFETELRSRLGARPEDLEFGRIIAEELVERSSAESKELFGLIRTLSVPGLRRYDTFDTELGHRPREFMTRTAGPEVDRIFELHAAAFARVATAIRLWEELFERRVASADPDRVVAALATRQLAYQEGARQRREAYLRGQEAQAQKRGLARAGASTGDPARDSAPDPIHDPRAVQPGVTRSLDGNLDTGQ